MSLDDFYLSSTGLASTETTLFIFNKELFRDLTPQGVVYEPFRVMVSNRLATNGSQWANTFERYNSGTYNNQWMIVDYNRLAQSPKDLQDGVLTVLEQVPNKVIIEDQTKALREKSYWASYNRAFYPEIQELVGQNAMIKQYGDWFTHDKTARAKIYGRDHVKVNTSESIWL